VVNLASLSSITRGKTIRYDRGVGILGTRVGHERGREGTNTAQEEVTKSGSQASEGAKPKGPGPQVGTKMDPTDHLWRDPEESAFEKCAPTRKAVRRTLLENHGGRQGGLLINRGVKGVGLC